MAMNVHSPYYAVSNAGVVFSTDRLYGAAGVDSKFDTPTAAGGYASYDTAAALHGYPGQLQQQQQHTAGGGLSYGPFDSQTPATVAKTSAYPPPTAFNYAPCAATGQPSPYAVVQPSRYLHDSKFDSVVPAPGGNDVIAQYGGRHFGTAAMMAAAAVATMGGQHASVGPAGCPALPIYPWMRSMGAGILSATLHACLNLHICNNDWLFVVLSP